MPQNISKILRIPNLSLVFLFL